MSGKSVRVHRLVSLAGWAKLRAVRDLLSKYQSGQLCGNDTEDGLCPLPPTYINSSTCTQKVNQLYFLKLY